VDELDTSAGKDTCYAWKPPSRLNPARSGPGAVDRGFDCASAPMAGRNRIYEQSHIRPGRVAADLGETFAESLAGIQAL
jgi:hypothetical protein